MAPERVTISLVSSAGEDAPLTVDDATRQILDFFEMLSGGVGEEGKLVSWRLVKVSMDSPLSITAEPFSDVPGIVANEIARREKATLANWIEEATTRGRVPEGLPPYVRRRAQSFFERNTTRIGRTVIELDDQTPPVVIVERVARTGISALAEAAAEEAPPDLTRTEIGSIEGYVLEATTFYGRPAVRIRERIMGAEVLCVFSNDLAEHVGSEHHWSDVWQGRRVLVTGEISYRQDGSIARLMATDVINIDARPLSYEDVADPNFTGGLGRADYVRTLWEEEVG